MGQLDIHLAHSIAAERRTTVTRDADHRRLARERSADAGVAPHTGVVSRAMAWLHPLVHLPAAR